MGIHAVRAGIGRDQQVAGVLVIQIIVEELVNGKVTVGGVGAAECLVKADFPEGLAECLNVVRAFETVKRVKSEAELVIIVFRQLVADAALRDTVIEIIKLVGISGSIDEFTDMLWNNLNADNKVSLFVRYVNLETNAEETRIVNKNK